MEEKLNIKVKGMFCTGCETRIKNAILNLKGIFDVIASYNNGEVIITYDKTLVTVKDIEDKIIDLDYEIVKENEPKENNLTTLCVLVILIALYIIFNHLGMLKIFNIFPTIESTMSYGMIFVVGILTSVHCIAMCGGINLSQSIVSNRNGAKITISNLAYNLGRVVSYTIIGGIVRSYRFSYYFKWHIIVPEGKLNGCNNEIIIPQYDISIKLNQGENIVEFMPNESGNIPYSCWMGMIKSNIKVIE